MTSWNVRQVENFGLDMTVLNAEELSMEKWILKRLKIYLNYSK